MTLFLADDFSKRSLTIRCTSVFCALFLSACSKVSQIDELLGTSSNLPVLSSVPTQEIQQTNLLTVDVNNIKKSSPGSDEDMSYTCEWDRNIDGQVSGGQPCSALPGTSASFNGTTGVLNWTPSTAELGAFEVKITGSNKGGSDSRVFTVNVRLQFAGLESLTDVKGDEMTLHWTPNPNATSYQILKKNADNTYSVYQTISNPSVGLFRATGLTPLVLYTWRVNAIDSLGEQDGNRVVLSAITSDLIRLEITAGATQLSPGQSTTVTARLKDNGGNYLNISGLALTFSNSGSGTSAGTFSSTTDLGNGTYNATFTATSPGTVTQITASIPQYYYVDTTAAMTVRPLQIEILTSATTLNPNRSITVTAKIRDYTGALISWGGHNLAFNYSSGTSTGTFTTPVDLGNGTYTSVFTGGTAGTAVTFGATISTQADIYSTVNVTVAPYKIVLTSNITDVSVTRTATITGRVKDWQGNYVTTGGQGMALSLVGAAGVASLGSVTDHNNGTYTATLTAISLGSILVNGSLTPSYIIESAPTITVRKLRLEVVSTAANLMPGQTASLTGRVKDWQGNLIGVGGSGFEFIASGGSSSGTIGSVTDNGNGTYSAIYTAGTAGTALTISGSINDSYQVDLTASMTVNKWRLFVQSAASTLAAGQSTTLTVTIKDYLGNQASTGGQTVFFSTSGGTSSGTFSSVTDNGNGTYTATFTALTPGTALTISASLAQSYQVDQTASITVESIRLVISTTQTTMNPGDTITVSAQVQDSAGNNLTAGSYTIGFSYSGGTSTGSFSAVTAMGNGLYRANFTGSTAGTAITLTATANVSYTVASTASMTVMPWKVEITAASSSIPIGQSTSLTARIRNHLNNYVTSGGANLAMSLLTTGRGSLSAVVDNSDGTYSATFTASGVGSTAVTASLPSSFTVTSAPTLTVDAIHLAVSAAQTSLNPGNSITVLAQVKDSSGNNLTTGSYTIGFSYSGGTSTGTFGSTTSLGNGLYSVTFTGAVAGTAIDVSASANMTYAVDSTASITVVPWKVEITAASSTVPIGQTTTITARIKDWQNNYLTSGGSGLSLSTVTAGIGSLSSIIDNSNGTYSVTFSASGTGSTTIGASLPSSFTVTSTPTITVEAIHLAITVTQSSVNPGRSITVNAQVKNSLGVSLLTGSYSIGFSYSGGTSTGTFGSTTSLGLGAYSAQFTAGTSGTDINITASANVSYVVDSTTTISIVPWKIEITASDTSYVINETGTLTARVKDWQGNTLSTGGLGVSMALATAGVGSIGSSIDHSDGTYTAAFTANSAGSTAVSASMPQSFTVTLAPTLTVEKVYIDVTVGSPESSSDTVASGNLIQAVARLKDSSGNLVTGTGYSITFSTTGGTSTVSTSSVTEYSPGVYKANLQGRASGTALTVSASATIAYQVNSTASLTVTPSSTISISNSTLSVSANTVRAGQSVNLTATLKDAEGNRITGLTNVSFAASTGSGVATGTFGSVTDAGNGTYTAVFTGSSAGTATTISVSSGALTVNDTVGVTVTSGSPSKLTVSGPTTLSANSCSSPFQLSFFDSSNNSTTLESTTSFAFGGLNLGKIYSDSNCTAEITSLVVASGASQSQLFYFKTYDPNTYALTFTASGITQQPSSYSVTTTALVNWVGASGNISLSESGGYFLAGKYDQTYQSPRQMSISGGYMYVADYTSQSITKMRLSDGALVGAIGRVANHPGAIPTGPSSNCTNLSVSSATTEWCTGGTYQNGTGDGMFNGPFGTTILDGYLYVTDYNNHRIMKYDASTGAFLGWSGKISTSPTSGDAGCNGATGTTPGWCKGGTSAASSSVSLPPTIYIGTGTTTAGNEFRNPTYISNDGTYLYVADDGNNRLVRIDPSTGKLSAWMGKIYNATGVTCSSGNTQTAGSFTDSWCVGGSSESRAVPQTNVNIQWQSLRGIAFWSDGTNSFMFISDVGGNRIIRYLVSTGEYRGWAGRGGSITPNTVAPPGGQAAFYGSNCNTVTANLPTQAWCYAGNSAASNSTGSLGAPFGLTVYGGKLYVVNASYNSVFRMDLATGVFERWIGRVSSIPAGGTAGCSTLPAGAVTPGWCTGGSSTSGYATGAITNGEDVNTDGTYLYVSDRDNMRIGIYNLSTGAAVGSMGLHASSMPSSWSSTYSGVPPSPSSNSALFPRDALFSLGMDLTINGSNLYIADQSYHRIKRYDWNTGSFTGWIGLMNAFSPTGGDDACVGAVTGGLTPGWCKGGGSTSSSGVGLNNPRGIATDGTSLYVGDYTNHRIVRYNAADGSFIGWIGNIATVPSDSLYDSAGCQAAAVGANTPNWCIGGTAQSSSLTGGFNNPRGLDIFKDTDDKYYLIVASESNRRLEKIDVSTGQGVGWVGRIGTSPTGGTGCVIAAGLMTPGWCSGGTGSSANTTSTLNNGALSNPHGVFINNYIAYVADTAGRVLRFNATTGAFMGWIGKFSGTITNSACVSGTATANTATPSWCYGGAYTSGSADGEFNIPYSIWGDSSYLYITDAGVHRIVRVNKSDGTFAGWKGKIATNSGMSCPGYSTPAVNSLTPTWCFGGTSKAGFDISTNAAAVDTPRGIWGQGSYLYVMDSGNGRILTIPK